MELSFFVPYKNDKSKYSFWKDIMREGYVVEIHVVDHCNLNCQGCNHFSPLAKERFLSIEHFTSQLQQLKKVLPNLRRLTLIGGEPFLHPQLLDFCKIAKGIFPKAQIQILTNGIILNKQPVSVVDEYLSLGVGLSISGYPGVDISSIREKTKDYPEMCWENFNSRMVFTHTTVDVHGQQPSFAERKFCGFHSLPLLSMEDYKIYICPFAAHIDLFNQSGYEQVPISKKDYIDIRDDNVNIETLINFCETDKDICKYCRSNDNHAESLWRPSSRKRKEFTRSQAELFADDYEEYNKIFNDLSLIKKYKENSYLNCVDENYAINTTKFLLDRYDGTAKLDIIIPFYNTTIKECEELSKNLLKQSIIHECVIYFISDGSPQELELATVFTRPESNFNSVFLKMPYRQGPGMARQMGIDNSTSKYLFFLDVDDLLISYTALEELYNLAESNNADFVQGLTATFENGQLSMVDDQSAHGILCSRSFLNKNKIRNIPAYFSEDYFWLNNLYLHNAKRIFLNKQIYLYNKTSLTSDRSKTNFQEKLDLKLLIGMYLFDYYNPDKDSSIDRNTYNLLLKDFIYNIDIEYNKTSNLDLSMLNFLYSYMNLKKDLQINYEKIKSICKNLEIYFKDSMFWENNVGIIK